MRFERKPNACNNAKLLRKNMTKEEKHLWYDFLNKYPVRFRRQEVIGNYIADFYCDKAKLIVEIDGSQHFDDAAIEYDNKRTKYFNSLGLRVLRFTNHEIHTMFQAVCDTIDITVKASP